MRVLITLNRFGLGGTESYSVTVAEQLEMLGHPTRLHVSGATSEGRALVASRGLRMTIGDHALGGLDGIDAAIVQDVGSAYLLADRPELRRICVVHGLAAFEQPPGAAAGSSRAVVLNDRILRRVEALGSPPSAVRMRQPIDIQRFRPLAANRPRARRVLALSNTLGGDRLRLLEEVCGDLGLELLRVGGEDHGTSAPEQAIAAADIVVGYGRSILEAMAMGKAAYVWERAGGDGWVTPEAYPGMEADGFAGNATAELIDADRLRSDLAAYTPDLGLFGQDLVRTHHAATKHAEALVARLGDGHPDDGEVTGADALELLALMTRAQQRSAGHAAGLEAECLRLWGLVEDEQAARVAAESQLAAMARSRSWRLTAPLRRLGERMRGSD